jgi:hypothetical protein
VMMRGHRSLEEGEILGEDWPWVESTYELSLPTDNLRAVKVELDPKQLQADIHRDNNVIEFDLTKAQEARQSH